MHSKIAILMLWVLVDGAFSSQRLRRATRHHNAAIIGGDMNIGKTITIRGNDQNMKVVPDDGDAETRHMVKKSSIPLQGENSRRQVKMEQHGNNGSNAKQRNKKKNQENKEKNTNAMENSTEEETDDDGYIAAQDAIYEEIEKENASRNGDSEVTAGDDDDEFFDNNDGDVGLVDNQDDFDPVFVNNDASPTGAKTPSEIKSSTDSPTASPKKIPPNTNSPTASPKKTIPITDSPTKSPTKQPTKIPTSTPKKIIPITDSPTASPTKKIIPITNSPTRYPTEHPTTSSTSTPVKNASKRGSGKGVVDEQDDDDTTLSATSSPTKSKEDVDDVLNNLTEEEKNIIKHEEIVEEEETAAKISIGFIFLTLSLMICTAQQMSENPDGVYAHVCRLAMTVTGCVFKMLLFPFRKICGLGNPYAHHLVTSQEFSYLHNSRDQMGHFS